MLTLDQLQSKVRATTKPSQDCPPLRGPLMTIIAGWGDLSRVYFARPQSPRPPIHTLSQAERLARLAFLSWLTGRDITTTNDLFTNEAIAIANWLAVPEYGSLENGPQYPKQWQAIISLLDRDEAFRQQVQSLRPKR